MRKMTVLSLVILSLLFITSCGGGSSSSGTTPDTTPDTEQTYTYYKDADGDGYSDGTSQEAVGAPVDYYLATELVATSGDCDDANAAINPDANDICDGLDNDCDAVPDPGCALLVINEVLYDDFGPDDTPNAFIELYDSQDDDLTGYSLIAINGADGGVYASIALTGAITAGGHYTIAHTNATAELLAVANQLDAGADLQNGPDSLALYFDYGGPFEQLIDQVGYGATAYSFESAPALDVVEGSSLGRFPNGQDTDDNSADFIEMELTPGRANTNGCASDASCDDGIACTTDTCELATGICSNTIDSGSCLIGGICYDNDQLNPGNECQICGSATTQISWLIRLPGSPCGAPDTACTDADTCDASGSCVSSGFKPPGSPCGNQTQTACTYPDTCDGNGSCLPNHLPNSVVCRSAVGMCDIDAICDGAGNCPANDFLPAGTPCDDGIFCTDDTCDGSGLCNSFPDDTQCDDGDAGTIDTCDPNQDCTNIQVALICGGAANLTCSPGYICDITVGCGITDPVGDCVLTPAACPAVIDPVCGCDGVTYGNDCWRILAGVPLAHDGECEE